MLRYLITIAVFCSTLSGCAAVVLGGATVGAVSMAEDKRDVAVQVDDTKMQGKISWAITNNKALNDQTNINAYVNNGIVLLTGQAPTDQLIQQAEQLVKEVVAPRKIHNQIRLSEPTAITTKAHDAWLFSKVQAKLYGTKDVNAFQMEIVVEDSEVFLLGQVTSLQAEKAVDIARNVGGVIKVINAFEIVP